VNGISVASLWKPNFGSYIFKNVLYDIDENLHNRSLCVSLTLDLQWFVCCYGNC